MREIKFRAREVGNWKTGHGWGYGNLVVHKSGVAVIEDDEGFYQNPINLETVGQFTGLLDRNGKEIYEGDILRLATDSNPDTGKNQYELGTMDFFEGAFVFMSMDKDRPHPIVMPNEYLLVGHFDGDVVGNIHDNPELMKT